MKKEYKKTSGFSINFWFLLVLALVVLSSLAVNFIFSSRTNTILNNKIAEAKEAERPADIDIIILKDLNTSCDDCFDVNPMINSIKEANIKINSERIIDINSSEGMELINKFVITRVPTFIMTGEIEKDSSLKTLWPKIGEVSAQGGSASDGKNNTFIFRQVSAPYILTVSGDVIGRAKLTMIWDRSCTECYDVTQHEIVLKQFGFFQEGQTIDAASEEGKELIEKYKIKLLPTTVLTGDINAYPALEAVWPSVGTVEEDGAYVFREGVKQMGIYKDLNTGDVVNPANNSEDKSN